LLATGQRFAADLYQRRYEQGIGGPIDDSKAEISERSGIAVAISGQVKNGQFGNPLPKVEVRLVNFCTDVELVTTTDAEGRFSFPEHPADCAYALQFGKRFFEVRELSKAAPMKDVRHSVDLMPGSALSLR
jgi:hypothetical protein